MTPLSLGIETLGGVATKLIERNTTVPTRKTEIFSTAEEGQTAVDVHVVQGEREMASDNKTLARFRLEGIPAAPRGVPQIEVAFDIDANGILSVAAKDLGTGKEQTITVSASTNLSKSDVERMVREAEIHAAEDTAKKEEVAIRNSAASLIYSCEKSLKDVGDKADASVRARFESALAELKRVSENGTAAQVKAASEQLQTVSLEFAQTLNQTTGAPGTGSRSNGHAHGTDGSSRHAAQDDVIDAQFHETT